MLLQKFIIENKDQLKYLWLPKNINWKDEESYEDKNLFKVVTRVCNDKDIITTLPDGCIELMLKKEPISIIPINNIHFEPDVELKRKINKCFTIYKWTYDEAKSVMNDNLTYDELYKIVINRNKTTKDAYYLDIKKDAIAKAYKKEQITNTVTLHYGYKDDGNVNKYILDCINSCIFPNDYLCADFNEIKITKCSVADLEAIYKCKFEKKSNEVCYYFTIPNLNSYISKEINQNNNIVAIDPGIKTPFTCYDLCGKVFKISTNKCQLLYTLMDRRDNAIIDREMYKQLQEEGEPRCGKKIRRIPNAIAKIERKINNTRREFQNLVIKYLLQTYKIILIPEFGFMEECCVWGHFSFRSRLIKKAQEVGCSVIIVNEDYTTKTCGNCGTLNDVGSNDRFTCSKCKLTLDRDVNAARNILIRYLAELYSSS